jgi:hypothetical protein
MLVDRPTTTNQGIILDWSDQTYPNLKIRLVEISNLSMKTRTA